MRIVSIITSELIVRKQKLENELERVLNHKEKTTDERTNEGIGLLKKLASLSSTIAIWEQYTNNNNTENNQ